MPNTSETRMANMQRQAHLVLKKIVPWVSESNARIVKYRENYKGNRGRIGIVGGARDYAGAPYFASMSAMRLGADLSYVICSRTASQSIKNYSPDLIVTPLLDCADDSQFTSEMNCLLTRLHALVIGPGLGRDELAHSRAEMLIREARDRSIPLVLDADSLLIINKDPYLIKDNPKVLLTPNRIELQRMLDSLYAPETFNLRIMQTDEIRKLVEKCSTDLGVAILAKGYSDVVCDGSSLTLLSDENSGSNRRCGGQGDIACGLAGVYSHWINMYNESSDAKIENVMAWAGYLAALTTRRCNELAYKEFRSGALASDMLNHVNPALTSLLDTSADDQRVDQQNSMFTGLLSRDEVSRYARHIIIDDFGPSRQLKLKQSSALIIGAGGLGCPASVYLGAGGIGCLGIVDDDIVEASNLHRQILHNVKKIGILKTESIKESILAINPNVKINCHSERMNRFNAVKLIENYDVIIDCTDNLSSRYMINDACVIAKKPLVSGAALKMDGQLTVYNYDSDTPCFRCLFPEPPAPNAVGSCSENGVLGILPGIIGVNQALEAMKIVTGMRPAYAGTMLLFDGQLGRYRHIKLDQRKVDCYACGPNSKLDRNLMDYEEFCGQKCIKSNDILQPDERIDVHQYHEILKSGKPHVLIDVRPKELSDVSRFRHAIQAPMSLLMNNPEVYLSEIKSELQSKNTKEIFVVCNKGIASQRGVKILGDLMGDSTDLIINDIKGGMTAWFKIIDP